MTGRDLRDLMRELADQQQPVRPEPGLWDRARAARRRRTSVWVAAAAVTALVAGGGSLLLRDSGAPPAPVAGAAAPAMPGDLYAVPSALAPDRDGGEWDEALRSESLAVGPTAAVLPVDGGALVAVSAVDGRYRGLRLPGLYTMGFFRYPDGVAALSPDGTRLAYAWGPETEVDGTVRSGVRIVDLENGAILDHSTPSEYGVLTHGFAWSPSGRWLAYAVDHVTSPSGDTVSGSRNYRVQRLDIRTGDRLQLRTQAGESAPSVNDAGLVAVLAGNGTVIDPMTGETSPLRLPGDSSAISWTPGGEGVVTSSSSGEVRVSTPDGTSGGRVLPPGEGDAASQLVRLLGWTGGDLVVGVDGVDTLRALDLGDLTSRPLITLHATGDAYLTDLQQVSLATDLLVEPTKDASRPDWSQGVWPGWWWLAGGVLIGGLALLFRFRRFRRHRPPASTPSPTPELS